MPNNDLSNAEKKLLTAIFNYADRARGFDMKRETGMSDRELRETARSLSEKRIIAVSGAMHTEEEMDATFFAPLTRAFDYKGSLNEYDLSRDDLALLEKKMLTAMFNTVSGDQIPFVRGFELKRETGMSFKEFRQIANSLSDKKVITVSGPMRSEDEMNGTYFAALSPARNYKNSL